MGIDLIALLIVAALTALAVSALLCNNMYRRFHDAGEKRSHAPFFTEFHGNPSSIIAVALFL